MRSENIILKLLQAADYNVEKAQRGIVYIDEVIRLVENLKIHLSLEMYREKESSKYY